VWNWARTILWAADGFGRKRQVKPGLVEAAKPRKLIVG
jgi:hypothetical protein